MECHSPNTARGFRTVYTSKLSASLQKIHASICFAAQLSLASRLDAQKDETVSILCWVGLGICHCASHGCLSLDPRRKYRRMGFLWHSLCKPSWRPSTASMSALVLDAALAPGTLCLHRVPQVQTAHYRCPADTSAINGSMM